MAIILDIVIFGLALLFIGIGLATLQFKLPHSTGRVVWVDLSVGLIALIVGILFTMLLGDRLFPY